MDKISLAIIESLEDQTYYTEARNWFTKKYISPIVDRSFLILLLAFISISSIIYCCLIYAQFPLTIKHMIPIHLDDTITYQPVLKDVCLIEKETDPNRAVAKYLAANYVKIWEKYSYDGLGEQLNKIMNNSTKHVYRDFNNYISLDNLNSPVLLYQRSIFRDVNITSVFLSDSESKATINFDAILTDIRHNILSKKSYIASVEFSMNDIKTILKNKQSKFYFIVTNYQSH